MSFTVFFFPSDFKAQEAGYPANAPPYPTQPQAPYPQQQGADVYPPQQGPYTSQPQPYPAGNPYPGYDAPPAYDPTGMLPLCTTDYITRQNPFYTPYNVL